jgi:hypothetical protein
MDALLLAYDRFIGKIQICTTMWKEIQNTGTLFGTLSLDGLVVHLFITDSNLLLTELISISDEFTAGMLNLFLTFSCKSTLP